MYINDITCKQTYIYIYIYTHYHTGPGREPRPPDGARGLHGAL